MIAVLSDIHANLEALNAVVDDIAARPVNQVFCLGDVIGYGPDPEACTKIVRQFDVVLLGQFERAIHANEAVHPTMEWTTKQLSTHSLAFLRTCPEMHSTALGTFAHGVFLDGNVEYLFPEDIYDSRKMGDVFSAVPGRHFCGKSHLAGVHTDKSYRSAEQLDFRYRFDGVASIINVGSVGVAREGFACYALVEDELTTFVRIDYDHTETVRKLRNLRS